MVQTTRHFKNCLGVFQGGGCKALAYVGAYAETFERGAFFSQVAGTSAGAIIAALIAAGATPEYLEEAILTTQFAKFMRAVDTAVVGSNYLTVSAGAMLGFAKLKLLSRFLKNLGLFSSGEIESWLESHLRKLLPRAEGAKVTFADLNLPLHVVAAEVGTATPSIWTTDTTPGASVAFAVRCSCTIPVFFQPVSGRFVDGGIVSNLPTFAIDRSRRSAFEKLLCFSFASSESVSIDTSKSQDPEQYVLQLISTIIDGAVTIQSSLQNDIHVIEIGKLPLGTLDFQKINEETMREMFAAGRAAAREFFDAETILLRGSTNVRPVLFTEPQTLNQIVREEVGLNGQVTVALSKTRYVYNLFPTFLHWRLSGTEVTILTGPAAAAGSPNEVQHDKFRRLVLSCLGFRVLEVETLPFEGVFFRSESALGSAIIFDAARIVDPLANFAVKYDRQHDSSAIASMLSTLRQIERFDERTAPAPQIDFGRGEMATITSRLRTIDQYKDKSVVIDFQEVGVERIVFLTKYVKSYKYGQISRMFELYAANSLPLFECARIRYTSGSKQVEMPVTPPVAEEHNGKLFLIEGNSRLAYLIKEKRATHVRLVVIKHVSARLPATGHFQASQLLISDEGKVGAERYNGWQRADYRPIEEAMRRPELYREVTI